MSPRWELPYWAGTVMLLFEAKEPYEAMNLISKGIEVAPGTWEFPFLKGYIFWKQFNNYSAASYFFSKAASLDNAPTYLGDLSSKFARKVGQDKVDSIFSELMDKKITDSVQKQIIKQRIGEP